MKLKHKIEISPNNFVNAESEIPDFLLALLFVSVTLSIYNLYR